MPLSEQQKPDASVIPKGISGQEVLKNLSDLLSDAESKQKLIDSITGKEKRPSNWAKSSNPPYYKERFAKELKVHLDDIIKDGEDRIFRYEDFTWLNKNSLYLMINQALRYLIDNLDPDKKYRAFRELLIITREKDSSGNPKGVRLSLAKDVRLGASSFRAVKIDREKRDEWRVKLENFIEEAPEGDVFVKKGLALSNDEIKELEDFLAQCPNILSNITFAQIKLIKTSSIA